MVVGLEREDEYIADIGTGQDLEETFLTDARWDGVKETGGNQNMAYWQGRTRN